MKLHENFPTFLETTVIIWCDSSRSKKQKSCFSSAVPLMGGYSHQFPGSLSFGDLGSNCLLRSCCHLHRGNICLDNKRKFGVDSRVMRLKYGSWSKPKKVGKMNPGTDSAVNGWQVIHGRDSGGLTSRWVHKIWGDRCAALSTITHCDSHYNRRNFNTVSVYLQETDPMTHSEAFTIENFATNILFSNHNKVSRVPAGEINSKR